MTVPKKRLRLSRYRDYLVCTCFSRMKIESCTDLYTFSSLLNATIPSKWCVGDVTPNKRTWLSQPARTLNSSERLWLVFAFISSTESSVIGYNAQSWINVSVSGSAPANADLNLAADHVMHWMFYSWIHERYNVIVSNILLEAALVLICIVKHL